ncbi:hypothetical protein PAXINDRAFT_17837 [Paxillus involutus ATCC 200175]|uniref:Uncharacterized protein n=1 Tax=Paxillus involutus ATCC 200175 TaxID=664439 RepID=A0A0C9SPK5_PAXIN|nr:hypothetical protein PAXINDRAFT_17837 [Paxillus involutus ATCC 200175]
MPITYPLDTDFTPTLTDDFDADFTHALSHSMCTDPIGDHYLAGVWANSFNNVKSTQMDLDESEDSSSTSSPMQSQGEAVHDFPSTSINPQFTNRLALYSTIKRHPSTQVNFINCLKAGGASAWSNIVLDTCSILWRHLSCHPCSREPGDKLCLDMLLAAFDHRTSVDPEWAFENHAYLFLKSVAITIQISDGRHFHPDTCYEVTVHTDPEDHVFMKAIRQQLYLVANTYRAHAWSNVRWLIYSRADHTGIVPLPEERPPDFSDQLARALEWDDSFGYGIFHHAPGHGPLEGEEPTTILFGHTMFFGLLHKALFDPDCPGWFALLQDVVGPDGLQFSVPLYSAESHAGASLTTWILVTLRDSISVSMDKHKGLLTTAKSDEVAIICNNDISTRSSTSRQQCRSKLWYDALRKKKTLILQLLEMQKVIEDVENEAAQHLSRETIASLRSKYYKSEDHSTLDGQFIATVSDIVVNPITCTPAQH